MSKKGRKSIETYRVQSSCHAGLVDSPESSERLDLGSARFEEKWSKRAVCVHIITVQKQNTLVRCVVMLKNIKSHWAQHCTN